MSTIPTKTPISRTQTSRIRVIFVCKSIEQNARKRVTQRDAHINCTKQVHHVQHDDMMHMHETGTEDAKMHMQIAIAPPQNARALTGQKSIESPRRGSTRALNNGCNASLHLARRTGPSLFGDDDVRGGSLYLVRIVYTDSEI